MAKILNSGLPAGSRGLWWFDQGLENLGTAATGDATLSGSVYSGGLVTHDTTTDRTVLASNSTLLLPTAAITIILGMRKTDATLRACGAFGHNTPAFDLAFRCGAHMPFSDGTVYWDFGGDAGGTTRLSVGSLTIGTTRHVWAVSTGARGMEIWQNGTKVASNAATPTRTGDTAAYHLGTHGGGNGDLAEYDFVFIHETQLSEALIGDIMADPEGELTEEGGAGIVAPARRGLIAAGAIGQGVIA